MALKGLSYCLGTPDLVKDEQGRKDSREDDL
jgi:hypothetical protein